MEQRAPQVGAGEEANASFISLFIPSSQGNTGLIQDGSPALVSSQAHPEGTSIFQVIELQSDGP